VGVVSSLGDAPGIPVIYARTCSVCGMCVAVCPVEILSKTEQGISVTPTKGFGCIACGQCMMVCPSDSIAVSGRKLSTDDLVLLPPPGIKANPYQLETLLLARRSIRKFRQEDLSRELLEQIIAIAATAPMGIPPWEVGITVFHGRDKVAELAADTTNLYKGFLKVFDNPLMKHLSRLLMKKSVWQQFQSFILPLGRILIEKQQQGEDAVLYNAPSALLFHVSPYADGADAFIACTYAMIAAEALGLGTCMIGCSAPMIGRRKDLLRKYSLPEGNVPKIVLIIGHQQSAYRKAIRRSFQSVNYY
jgi:nitroreductase/NAD-dependent dihydropyrimidine dehydrogenase PreA subunit